MTTIITKEQSVEIKKSVEALMRNYLRTHKLKMVDVLTEMTNNPRWCKAHKGRIYNHNHKKKTHSLYEYFVSRGYDNPIKWFNRPDWFVHKLKDALANIRGHPSCFKINSENDKKINLVFRIIDMWLDKPNEQNTYEWKEHPIYNKKGYCDVSKKKVWQMGNLISALNNIRPFKGEYYDRQEEYDIIREWCKKSDGTYFPHQTSKLSQELYAKISAFRKDMKNDENSLYYDLKCDFTRFTTQKQNDEVYRGFYTLKIPKVYEGRMLNYSASHSGRFSMLRWKKTTTNGNCSNKDLKATHLYYREKGDWGKGGWVFKAVTIDDAYECALMNGFPKWGKKGNGKAKPSYKDLKMWWYKLAD